MAFKTTKTKPHCTILTSTQMLARQKLYLIHFYASAHKHRHASEHYFHPIHTLFLNPKQAPTNVSGIDTPNHRASRARSVVNGTAALLCLAHRMRLSMKNMPNMTLKQKQETQVDTSKQQSGILLYLKIITNYSKLDQRIIHYHQSVMFNTIWQCLPTY